MTQLSPHFALSEFCESETAARMGREIVPDDAVIANLRRLCEEVLEPARVMLGKPFVITSGWRPPWLNAMIGGSSTSAHVDGRAADIKVVGMPSEQFAEWLSKRALPFDQIIDEFNPGGWCHVGIAETNREARRQYLIARKVDGKTQYTRKA